MTEPRVFTKRERLLAIIHIVLTVLVVIAFIVNIKMGIWLHSMSCDDPIRQEWQPRLAVIGGIIWFGALGSWLLFTVFHVIVRVIIIRRKKGGATWIAD